MGPQHCLATRLFIQVTIAFGKYVQIKVFFFFLQTQFIIYVIGLGRQMAQNCTVKAWIPFQNRLISAGGTLHIAYGSGREDLFGGPGCSESSCVQ